MKKLEEILIKYNNLFEIKSKNKEFKNKNGIYIRTLMLFYSYCKIPINKRSPQQAYTYLKKNLNCNLNNAALSRNNNVLVKLGLISLIENKNNKREKIVKITDKGIQFSRLFE